MIKSEFNKPLMNSTYDFPTDKIDIFFFNTDASNSMVKERDAVIRGLQDYQNSFKGFPEANSIAVSITKFSSGYYPEPFCNVRDFAINYYPDGATALYYSIVKSAEYLMEYMKEVTKRTGVIPRATFVTLSDGQPYHDKASESSARSAIEKLNNAGITTVFVAFGEGINSDFGKRLGFVSVKDSSKDKKAMQEFFGEELSRSCKEQSMSLKPLGENFFSQAVGASEGYSQKTSQVLEDDDYFLDDI